MKTRNTLALAALVGMGMLGLTSCNEEHDLRTQPPGTGLLALGEVTVAGTDVAGTRAAIAQDAAGFIGIRKTEFKAGDVLALSLSVPQGAPAGSPLSTTAKLGTNGWTLAERTYYAAGTKLTATYTATPAAGTPAAALAHKDDLTATITPVADGTPIALTLTHANALIEVTPPAGITGDAYTIKVNATPSKDPATGNPGSAEDLATAREEGNTTDQLRYRTIALPGTVNSITLTANGITYTATLNSLQVEANKRYPIALSVKDSQLTATVNPAGDLNWGDGGTSNGHPAGYSRYIATAEDLAQFAADVSKNTNGAGLAAYTALQIADIDLSTLRTAADANTYYNTSKYNYTATSTQWVPIGGISGFKGKYNGNGHTISNLTIRYTGTDLTNLGLFSILSNAYITGVHLRNCTITSTIRNSLNAGALAGRVIANSAPGSIVNLCSATGSVSVSAAVPGYVGGLIGWCYSTNSSLNSVSRCSSDVAVSLNSGNGGHCGAFVGLTLNTNYAACIASGTVTKTGTSGTFSGFSTQEATSTYGGYRAYSCITNSEMVNTDGSERSAFGMSAQLLSCIATQPSYTNFAVPQSGQPYNCVCLGSVTGNIYNEVFFVTADQAYSKLTKAGSTNILPMKTLHWSKDDGYTLNEVDITVWDFITKAWVESPNGLALPTLDMSYEGTPAP